MVSMVFAWLCVLSFWYGSFGLEFSLATPTWAIDYLYPRDTWTGLRVLPHYITTRASEATIRELKTDIVPTVTRWFGRVLKVPRLPINLKVPISLCGPVDVPYEHQSTGVAADVLIYVIPAPYQYHQYDKRSYGTACLLNEIAPYRVLAGVVWIQMDWFNGLTHNRKVDTVAQHFAQALGFDSLLFQHYTKPNGYRYEENELHATVTMAGVLRHVLTLPTVVQKARLAFNCPSLVGVRLSGDETDDSRSKFYEDNYIYYKLDFTRYLTLWSARVMLNDFMSDLVVSDRAEYSSVTMAVFQDSGWYEVDFNYTAPPRFAYKRGCSFLNGHCVNSRNPSYPEFCRLRESACNADFTKKGNCDEIYYYSPIPSPFDEYTYNNREGGNVKVDYCPIVESGSSCLEGDAEEVWEERCADCRCFAGDYKPEASTDVVKNTHCHKVTCTLGKAYVKVAGQSVQCPAEGGTVAIPGFSGSMVCPSVDRVCKAVPCKNLCSGRGKCENSVCTCDSGYYGEDCALVCHQSCKTCVAGSQVKCATCRVGAVLSSGKCLCLPQFQMNASGECVSLAACHHSCLSCSASDANSCRSCRSPSVLSANGTCTCPNYKVMSTAGVCVDCTNGCVHCSYPDTSTCLSSRRLSTCSPSEFLNAENEQCESCFPPCATCMDSSTFCLSCIDGFTLSDSQCKCADGKVEIDGQCVSCHTNCQTCIGVEDTLCTSCRSDSLLKSRPGPCVCRTASSTRCAPCDPECLTCSVADPFQCESCKENASVDPTTRRCLCNSGYYMISLTLTCGPCHQSCATCSGPTPNHCNSCVADYDYLDHHACYCHNRRYLDLTEMKCVDCIPHCATCSSRSCETCDSGFVKNSEGGCDVPLGFYYDEVENRMLSCPSHCAHCQFSERPTLVCLDCKATFHLDSNGDCGCGVGKSAPYWDETCQLCSDHNCAVCDTSLYCRECLPTFRLRWSNCYCDPGFFEINHSCQACPEVCAQCRGERDCTQCIASYYLDYSVPGEVTCSHCHKWCSNCNGPAENHCLGCWPYAIMIESGKCFCTDEATEDTCWPCGEGCEVCANPDGSRCTRCKESFYLLNDGDRDCTACHPWCRRCNGPDNNQCVDCWYYSSLLETGKCYCREGVSEQTCWRCTANCLTCTGPGELECTRCKESYYMDTAAGSNTCNPCHPWCRECDGPNNDQCTSCHYYTSLEWGKCACWMDYTTTNCWPCAEGCRYCSGPTLSTCSSCTATYYLDTDSVCKHCYRWCRYCSRPESDQCDGCWWSSEIRETARKCYCRDEYTETNCLRCAENCYLCTGTADNECTGCRQSYFLIAVEGGQSCSPCHPWCRNCNGSSNDQCTECWSYSSFIEGEPGKCYCNFHVTERTCWYSEAIDACHPQCLTCYGKQPYQCQTCHDTGVLKKHYYYGEERVCECLSGQESSGTCWPCSYECESCKENGLCASCFYWLRFEDPGTCFCSDGWDWQRGLYPDPDIYNCQPCFWSCRRCTGPNANQCTDCVSSLDLSEDGRCGCRAMSALTPSGVCLTRDFFCADDFCDSCRGLAERSYLGYYGREIGKCGCPESTSLGTGLYADTMAGICHKCGPLCLNCARDTRICWDCKAHSHLSYISPLGPPGFCECDFGYFPSYEYEECLLCPPGCTACKSDTDCTACEYGYELVSASGSAHCQCFSSFCKCPVGLNAVLPFDFCEETCPTGSISTDRVCIPSGHSKFVFRPISMQSDVLDQTERFRATFGDPNIEDAAVDARSPIPIYRNGVYFKAERSAYITIAGISETLVLGAEHYLELWEKGTAVFSVHRGSGLPTISYSAGGISIKLTSSENGANFHHFSHPAVDTSAWVLIRYDVQAYKYRLGTRVRVYRNNIQLSENIVLDQYYRDDAFDGGSGDLTIWTDRDLMLGDFVVANRLWAAEMTTPCECPHCTVAGSCLSDCGPMEFMKADRSCGQCDIACSLGCVRGTDCSRSADPLCITYSNFTGCSACKAMTTLSSGVCSCIPFATLQVDNTCSCGVHGRYVSGACEFVPDPLCRSYLRPPDCATCVSLAEVTNEFCTCIPHSTYSESSDSCICDLHYLKVGNQCVFDPLCNTATGEVCTECLPRATYDGTFCQCVPNASHSDDFTSCTCDPSFKPFANKCIPQYDPLCAVETSGVCTQCKVLAVRVEGICECSSDTHYDQLTQSCLCGDGFALLNGSCVSSADPLCARMNPDDTCAVCKGLAALSGTTCQCVADTTAATDNLSCHCNAGLKPFENRCITADDPLCIQLNGYLCVLCAPLSHLVGGLCQCVDHASFSSESCLCDPLFAEYQNTCAENADPLCVKLAVPGVCDTCKPLATGIDGVCGCVSHAHLLDTSDTCACDRHYTANNEVCEFLVDPLCITYDEGGDCTECKAFSASQDGVCVCIEHASVWLQPDQCDCDFHYKVNADLCEYDPDPLCATFDPAGKCSQCKPAAYYQDSECTCGSNAIRAVNGQSCVCLAGFKVYLTKCIPSDDPLCINLDGELCTECASLATLVDGTCTCITYASYSSTTKTCECEPGYVSYEGRCVSVEDPLCGRINSEGQCVACKPQAEFSGRTCACVIHSSPIADNSTCQCDRRYLPTPAGCELDRDPLCDVYNASDECTACKALSELRGELCECVGHASTTHPGTCNCDPHYIARLSRNVCEFDPDPLCLDLLPVCRSCKPHSSLGSGEVYCRCDEGYSLKVDTWTCELCAVFLLPTDVTVEIPADYSQLQVTFSASVNSNVNCRSVFAGGTFSKFGSKASCVWNSDRTLLSVALDDDSTIVEEDLEFNATATINSNRPCSFQALNFKSKAKYSGNRVRPVAVLRVPSAVSLGCGNSAIQLDSKGTLGGVGHPLKYKWTLTHSAGVEVRNDYHTYSAKDFISLNTKNLQPGTLYVTLTVKDRLGQEDTKTDSIELKQESKISVEFDIGKSIKVTTDSKASVRTIVSNACGQSGQKTYAWSYEGTDRQLSATDKDPTAVLSVSKIPNTLIVDRGSLAAGRSYTFKVDVKQGSLSGSARLTVVVLPSALSVRLNRASGSHPRDVRFALSAAGSFDPDDMPGNITYEWKCVENNSECRDDNRVLLVSDKNKADVAIESDKLRLNAVLNFTVTIRKDSRVSSASAVFTIVEPTGITVLLPPFFKTILRHLYFAVVPKIETRYQTFFSWKQVPAVTASPDSPPDASYLCFPAYRLPPGKLYHFEVTAATLVGTMKQQASFYVISEPLQGYVGVDPLVGREVLDRFVVSTAGWFDPDGNYPLSYQFCAQLSASVEVCICPQQYSAWSSAKLTAGTYPIVAKAINSLGGFGQSNSPAITVQDLEFYRQLVDISIQESFIADIDEPQATLGMVSVYSRSLSFDQQFYSFVLTTLSEHLNALFEVSFQDFESFLGAAESMATQNASRDTTNAEALLRVTAQTLARYDSELTEPQLSRTLGIATALSASAPGTAARVLGAAVTQFYRGRYPSTWPFTYVSPTLQLWSIRQHAGMVTAQTVKVGNVSVSIPSQWLNSVNLTTSDVVDMQFSASPGELSQVVQVSLSKSANYSGYNLDFQESVPLTLFNATAEFNITLPATNATESECAGLDARGQWDSSLCSVVASKSGTVTISARSLTSYCLRPIATSEPPAEEGPVATSAAPAKGAESINPAPSVFAGFDLVFCLAVIFALRKWKHPSDDDSAEKSISAPDAGLSVDNEMTNCRHSTIHAIPIPQLEVPDSFWHHHALVYILLQRSPVSVFPLAALMTTDLVVLGLCYTCWSAGDDSAETAMEVFQSYSAQDMVYVALAVAVGTAVYCISRLGIRVLKKKGVGLCGAIVLGECCGVVVMNVFAGFGPAGRWGIGALWTLLIQVLVVETAKAALVSTIRRHSTQLPPAATAEITAAITIQPNCEQ